MHTVRAIIIIMVIGLAPWHVTAEPSKPIAKFMDAPASAFDVFLFRVKEEGKCYQTYWGNPGNQKLDLCLTGLVYNFDDNIIEMNFFVYEHHELLQGISGKSKKDKEDTVKSILTKVAEIAGVEKRIHIGYSGWIQSVPIRHGWSTKNLNMNEVREEIRKRTIVRLYTDPIDGQSYKAVRSHYGEITIVPNSY